MINRFYENIIGKYGLDSLRKICNVNIRLVPEHYIIRMKNALSLQCPSVENACCHFFLGIGYF